MMFKHTSLVSCLGLALGAGLAASSPFAAAQAPVQLAAAGLPRVTVMATRFDADADTLPVGISVITAKEIRDAGAATVNEAIMKLLGVPGRQDSYGGGNYGLDLRGFGATADNNQVVILDGIRLSEADLGGTRLSGIPIDTVERIEVLRGSSAVLYGEGATAGAIVISTKAGLGRSRSNQAQAYAAAGSHRLRELRAGGTVVAGDFSLDLNANTRQSDNHRDNFHAEAQGASATGQWGNEWMRAGVRLGYDDLDTQLPGWLSAAQYAANPRQSNTPGSHADIRNETQGLFWRATLAGWVLAADAGWRQKALRSIDGFAYDYDVNAKNQALRAQRKARLGAVDNELVLGADRNTWRRDVFGAFGSIATLRSLAFYAKDEVALPVGTRLSAGVRTEQVEKTNTTATGGVDERRNSWELGAVQPLGGGLSAYARVGTSFRFANADEFGFTAFGIGLRPQASRDTEGGVRWSQGQTRAELRAYRNNLTDEIGYDPSIANTFFPGANVNFDPTRRQGVELELSHAVTAALQLRVNAAARSAKFRAGPYVGKDVPLAPRRTLAVRADWKLLPDQQLGAGVNLVSSQHPDHANACSMPGHATLDLRYAYQWRATQWALGMANATDRKYYTQAYSCIAGETSAIYPEAGRTVTASVRVSF